jgi:hypothetical protein
MMGMKTNFLIPVCFFAGIVGGWLGAHLDVSVISKSQAENVRIVSAQAFNLIDSKGKLRGQIAMSPDGGPGIFLMDDKGRARLALGVYSDGTGHIVLNDRQGQATHVIRSYGPQESPLLIFNQKGQDQMIMGLNPAPGPVTPFLVHYDSSRQKKLEFGKYDGP